MPWMPVGCPSPNAVAIRGSRAVDAVDGIAHVVEAQELHDTVSAVRRLTVPAAGQPVVLDELIPSRLHEPVLL